MDIIAHRGFWLEKEEKNTKTAFEKALLSGFGIETDIRDFRGELVVSHDIPGEGCMTFREFLEVYSENSAERTTLALNVKSDGLQKKLRPVLSEFNADNYFVFDMSIPDTLMYVQQGFRVFQRQSDVEKDVVLYDEAKGIWMDEFYGHWIKNNDIEAHLENGKDVCIVSPELHKRPYEKEWEQYKELENKKYRGKIMLCTDHPEKARRFFSA